MIRKYAKAAGCVRLSANFCLCEFHCKCTDALCVDTYLAEELVIGLQIARNFVGPITVNSGFRCRDHNQAVGGVADSPHLKGIAADIKGDDVGVKRLFLAIQQVDCFLNGGIGTYKDRLHVDVRGEPARWKV